MALSTSTAAVDESTPPDKAIIAVENYLYATSQLAQTTLRSVCGQAELDELLAERDKINKNIQSILDRQTDPWGVKVSVVEVKAIDLPDEMKRAMAKQAEAERERRATIITSSGELSASMNLMKAAANLSKGEGALHLRTLQTIREVAADPSEKIIFAVPMEVLRALEKLGKK